MREIYTRGQYDNREIPVLVFTQMYIIKKVEFMVGDEYSTYHYNYDRMVDLLLDGIIIEQ